MQQALGSEQPVQVGSIAHGEPRSKHGSSGRALALHGTCAHRLSGQPIFLKPSERYVSFCRYAVYKDPAGWLNINPINGTVDTRVLLDRESPFVHNSVYKALFLAIDSGESAQI